MYILGLTELRKIECDSYIFPDDVFKIPELDEYSDVKTIEKFAYDKLMPYAGEDVSVYINGKLSTELLAVLKAADKLQINLTIGHRNNYDGQYMFQKVRWKSKDIKTNIDYEYSLCEGRHYVPVEESIYTKIPENKIFDFEWMEVEAKAKLEKHANQCIALYITGLPSLYVSVLNVAHKLGISLICMHYDIDTDEYFPQYLDE